MKRPSARWTLLALAAAGCSFVPDNEARAGAMGNGSFGYQCIDNSDAFCPSGGLPPGNAGTAVAAGAPTVFPNVALGGRFGLHYFAGDTSTYPSVNVAAVSSDFFRVNGSVFVALRPGAPWFVAELANDQVLDIGYVNVSPIVAIDVADHSSALPSSPGSTHVFGGTPQDADHLPLAGVVLYAWTTSDPSVLTLPADGAVSSTVQVVFAKAGTAILAATSQGVTGTLRVTVAGGVGP